MCTLLNMCLPFEVRYLGTCIEELGKHDYTKLRDAEEHANKESHIAEVTKVPITDKCMRKKLALYMALLHSYNPATALILFKNLSSVDLQEVSSVVNGTPTGDNEQMLEELLLVYVLASNHPAFTFEQKSMLGDIYQKLKVAESRLNASKPDAKSSEQVMTLPS